MQHDNNFDFDVNLQDLTHEQLVDLVKRLHVSVKRAQTFESTTSGSSYNSFNAPNTQPLSDPVWIRAEVDYPYDRDNGNNFTILAYDQTMHNIGIRNRHEFKDKEYVVYSKIPSRLKSKIYVFRENCALSKGSPRRRYRVSSHQQTPKGYLSYCEIHLKRVGLQARILIWLGVVKWLFILPDPNARQSSFETEKDQTMC